MPQKFKPGHINAAKEVARKEGFDPRSVGWDPEGPLATEFARLINRDQVGPRERHRFPESCNHDHGWLQGISGNLAGRSHPAGSNPSDLGMGWLSRNGTGGPTTKLSAGRAATMEELRAYEEALAPKKAKDRNPREHLGVPPFATVGLRSSASSAQPMQRDGTSLLQPPGRHEGPEACTGVAASRPRSDGVPRAASTPALAGQPSLAGGGSSDRRRAGSGGRSGAAAAPGVTPAAGRNLDEVQQILSQEGIVNTQVKANRRYQNRVGNSWYHPLSQSDVALFSDSYTKCWHKNIFAKKS